MNVFVLEYGYPGFESDILGIFTYDAMILKRKSFIEDAKRQRDERISYLKKEIAKKEKQAEEVKDILMKQKSDLLEEQQKIFQAKRDNSETPNKIKSKLRSLNKKFVKNKREMGKTNPEIDRLVDKLFKFMNMSDEELIDMYFGQNNLHFTEMKLEGSFE